MLLWEIISLLLSSGLSLATIFLQIPSQRKQQIIAVLLVILLVFVSRTVFANSPLTKKRWFRVFALSFSSLLVQMLVISSGGMYSPFLPLIHFFTAGVSFIFNIAVALSFLALSAVLLFLDIQLDPNIHKFFLDDPWTAALLSISFLVMVPISFLIARSYHLKDSLSKILSEHIQMGRIREESILSGLNELVIVTDLNLGVLYLNSQAEKELGVSTGLVLHHHIFSILSVRDVAGNPATSQSLSVDKALVDKATRIISDFYFYGKRRVKVSIQIKPILDLSGKVIQLVFVVTDAKFGSSSTYQSHMNLEQAHNKYNAMFDDLRKTLLLTQSQELVAKIELLHKIEEDLLIATELEDHPIKEVIRFQDVALLCKQVVVIKRNFARGLKVPIVFSLPDNEVSESSLLSLVESNATESMIPISDFTIPADFRWLTVMVEKLLDMSLLLSMSEPIPQIDVFLHRDSPNVYITILCRCSTINQKNVNELFIEHFGNLALNTGLRFGSGLEGYIIKMIKEQLNVPLEIKFYANPAQILFTIKLSKKPH